jgi:hypothetical protein
MRCKPSPARVFAKQYRLRAVEMHAPGSVARRRAVPRTMLTCLLIIASPRRDAVGEWRSNAVDQ